MGMESGRVMKVLQAGLLPCIIPIRKSGKRTGKIEGGFANEMLVM
jgi:hypothetical protein